MRIMSRATLIDIDEAYEILFRHVRTGRTEDILLGCALHRTLATRVQTDVDDPPFDRSIMDGYAVRAEDVAGAPIRLAVVGEVPAGRMPDVTVGRGQAVRINTGGPIPPGADAVVRVEDCEPDSGAGDVLIRVPVERGRFVTMRGAHVAAGTVVLEEGTRLTPSAVGVAAAAGAATVSVYRRPTVAVLSTGDELVDVDHRPEGAQIRNSNQYLLAGLVATAHADPVVLPVAPDDRSALRERIQEGLRADVLCITGGISMGSMDLVPGVLEALGATMRIRKIAIKPGRPTLFATMPDGSLVFALPGNPASALIGFELLVRPALAALQGRVGERPKLVAASLRGTLAATSNRQTYRPARALLGEGGAWIAEPLSWKGSGDAFGMAGANAWTMQPPGSPAVVNGDSVRIHLLDHG